MLAEADSQDGVTSDDQCDKASNMPSTLRGQDLPLALRLGHFLNGTPPRARVAEQRSALLVQDRAAPDDHGSAPSIMSSTVRGQELPLALRLGHFLNGTPPRASVAEQRSALLAEAARGTCELPVVAVAESARYHASSVSGVDLDNVDDEVLVIREARLM
jgi:hypothetical protein